ncbi:eCIS core domain-containing protein [Sorangium cellulosum]|uniref:eCIS core domain-containing protein n=1 Tax=Sorangium cellulosum TaxID=56 RepID=UPI00041610C3|nr:DUF4157 domain-containing protein [Sorangium cellulosum]
MTLDEGYGARMREALLARAMQPQKPVQRRLVETGYDDIVKLARTSPGSQRWPAASTAERTRPSQSVGASAEVAIQTKLHVSSPDDALEEEADRVADQVMRMPAPPASDNERDEALSLGDAGTSAELQRVARGGGVPGVSAEVEDYLNRSRGGGRRVSPNVRNPVEALLQRDLRDVRVHDDALASEAAAALEARAFTSGSDIYVSAGESSSDRRLMAHELTHVVQQSRSARPQPAAVEIGGQTERPPELPPARTTMDDPAQRDQTPTAPGRGADHDRREAGASPSGQISNADRPSRAPAQEAQPRPPTQAPAAAESPLRQEQEPAADAAAAESPLRQGQEPAAAPAAAPRTTATGPAPEGNGPVAAAGAATPEALAEGAAKEAEAGLRSAVAEARAALAEAPDPVMPEARTPGQQVLLDALAESAAEGRRALTEAVVASIDAVAATADEQAQGITQAAEQQVAEVSASAAHATAGVDASVAAQTSAIQAAEAGEQAQIAVWEGAATRRAADEVQSRATRIAEAGAEEASRATEAGNAATDQAEAALTASEAEARGQSSAGAGGEGAAREGHAEVARRVSSDAADQMSASAPDAGARLQVHAEEAAGELARHAGQASATVAAEAGPLMEGLSTTAGAAREGVAGASRDAAGALGRQGRSAGRAIAAAESGATAHLRARGAEHRSQVAEAGAGAVEVLREQAGQTVESSRELQAAAAEQLVDAQVDEETAAGIGGEIRERIAEAHGEGASAASSAGDAVSAALSGASAESATNLAAGTSSISSRLDQASADFASHADGVAGAASGAMGSMREAAASAGDEAVATTASTLDAAASTAASGFGQAVGALEQSLNHGASEVDRRAGEALGGVRGRIAEGQRRVDEHVGAGQRERGVTVQRSVLSDVGDWFAEQLADLWNMLKSPSFWVGLIVTLVLFPVMGPGALVVGGLAGGIVAGIEENIASGRPWYDPHAIIRNAAIGTFAGAAMALGVGVIIGLGLEGAAAVAAAMVLSAGIGIVANIATGQRWDRGLLANLFLAWLFARLFKVGSRPRPNETPAPGGRTTARVPGLYEAIDPAVPPKGGWTFTDVVRTSGDVTNVRTTVVAPDGTTGSMARSYNATTGEFSMDYAFLDNIPSGTRWVQTTPEMVSGRGTPLETYMTMRQMRILEAQRGATFAGPRRVHMSTIINNRTLLQIAAREATLNRPMSPAELDAFILETHSVQYAQNSIVQSGGRIASARVSGGARVAASGEFSAADLAANGIRPDQQVLSGFDIDLNVVSASEPPPAAGPVPVPIPPGRDAGTD